MTDPLQAMQNILNDIVDAAGFRAGQPYTADAIAYRLMDRGREEGRAKIAELMRERDRLHAAMLAAREHLQDVPVDASAALRARFAANILSRALGLSSGESLKEDAEAEQRLAQQALQRD